MDDQRRPPFDAHPVVFAAKQSSRVCASDDSEGESARRRERVKRGTGDWGSGWQTRRKGSLQHFFFVFKSAEIRGSRDQDARMIEDDQRSEDEIYDAQGKQCNEQDWCLEASQKLFA